MPTKNFSPAEIEQYKKGILLRDYMAVYAAVDAGVDMATPIPAASGSLHPLESLVYARHNPKQDITAAAFNERGTEIINYLLGQEIPLVEDEIYANASCDWLVDRLTAGANVGDVSNIVIRAIQQSLERGGDVYELDDDVFINNYLDWRLGENGDLMGKTSEAVRAMQTLHDAVRQRLESPTTDVEKDLAENYGDALGYWLEDIELPSAKNFVAQLLIAEEQENGEEAEGGQFDKMVKTLPKKTPREVMAEIGSLIGMDDFKRNARSLVLRTQFDAARASKNMPVTHQAMHTVFGGNPGTGKTTVARLKAELLYSLGLGGPRYLEISRENMVGQYIGQTEKKMVALLNSADTIFIDEAYNLVGDASDKKDYGNHVVDALMTALENRREELTVFFAGYPDSMKTFLAANPGLKSRISNYQQMNDYTTEELGLIMDFMLEKSGLKMDAEARDFALTQLAEAKESAGDRDFGNARIVRTLVEQLPNKMSERLFAADGVSPEKLTEADLSTVTKADVAALRLSESIGIASAKEKKREPLGYRYGAMKSG